jgi:hypothetical protein
MKNKQEQLKKTKTPTIVAVNTTAPVTTTVAPKKSSYFPQKKNR